MKSFLFWTRKYLEIISFKKILNNLKLNISYFLSFVLKRNFHLGNPSTISIEPTTSCNLKCPECPSGLRKFSRPTGNINEKTIQRILSQMGDYLIHITFYFQGEPFLINNFSNYVKLIKSHNILVSTSTNGHFITSDKTEEIIKSGLDRLIISLDGTDQNTYAKYRIGGNYETVVENIKHLVATKKRLKSKTPFIELQFIVFKHNQHQIADIKDLGKKIGVDKISLKTAQLYEVEQGNELMPGLIKYSRYQEYENGKYRIKSKLKNRCYRSWIGNVITWDGNVVPCCFDKDAEHVFGNIITENYSDIQKSKKYKVFINSILQNRSNIKICKNCSEGL